MGLHRYDGVYYLKNGSTLVGTFNQGLFRYHQNKVESLYGSLNTGRSIPELAVTVILETSDNSVIVGAETQLYLLDNAANSVRALPLVFGKSKTHPAILSPAQNNNGDVWIGTRDSATYTNLPPGNYTFRVQGANSTGVWNIEGTSIETTVHPATRRSWQAYLLYFTLFSALLMLVKKYYDNSVLREQSVILVQQMYDAADKATDDLQEQLEYQDEFVKSVHAHSTSTLKLIGDFIAQQANSIDDDLARDAILNNTDRVAALGSLEECLFYQGDQLFANLEDYTNIIIDTLVQESPSLARSITTINEIPSRLIPVDLATPLSTIIFELLKNSFQHAFENSASANYIHIRMEDIPGADLEQETTTRMSVQDNGVGMPANIQRGTGETSGLAIASSIAKRIDAEFTIAVDGGTTVSLLFPRRSNII